MIFSDFYSDIRLYDLTFNELPIDWVPCKINVSPFVLMIRHGSLAEFIFVTPVFVFNKVTFCVGDELATPSLFEVDDLRADTTKPDDWLAGVSWFVANLGRVNGVKLANDVGWTLAGVRGDDWLFVGVRKAEWPFSNFEFDATELEDF